MCQISPSLAIYDTMQNLRSSVSTRCIGSAYDISAFILAAGKKVGIIENSTFAIFLVYVLKSLLSSYLYIILIIIYFFSRENVLVYLILWLFCVHQLEKQVGRFVL